MEQRIQDGRATLAQNVAQMNLAPDILNAVLLMLAEAGIEVPDDVLALAENQPQLQQQQQPQQQAQLWTPPSGTQSLRDLIKSLRK